MVVSVFVVNHRLYAPYRGLRVAVMGRCVSHSGLGAPDVRLRMSHGVWCAPSMRLRMPDSGLHAPDLGQGMAHRAWCMPTIRLGMPDTRLCAPGVRLRSAHSAVRRAGAARPIKVPSAMRTMAGRMTGGRISPEESGHHRQHERHRSQLLEAQHGKSPKS